MQDQGLGLRYRGVVQLVKGAGGGGGGAVREGRGMRGSDMDSGEPVGSWEGE